jgi:uncharacterized membrane protein
MDDREQTLTSLERRLDELERRTENEITGLRAAVAAIHAATAPAEPTTVFKPQSPIEWAAPTQPETAEPLPAPAPRPAPRAPREPSWFEQIDWAAYLTGPRGLAVAGGVVSLLGIVFLFVLAVDRGWVTPGMRVGFGLAVSVALFAAASEIMRRYGQLYAATAAVAAAIGGSYTTLYAASALYHFVPPWAALIGVAAIASTSVALAAWWNSEFVAGLGLVSATYAPVAVQHDVTFVGLLFAAVVFAGSATLLLAYRWRVLTAACWGSTGVLTMIFLDDAAAGQGIAAAAIFGGLYIAAASVEHALREGQHVSPLAVSLPLSTVLLELVAVHEAWGLEGTRPGIALLLMAAACAGPAAVWFGRPSGRSMSAILWAVALVFAGAGTAALLTGAALSVAWALEAAALFALAVLLSEIRLQLAATAYALLAAGHALILDLPPSQLSLYQHDPARGSTGPAVLVGALSLGALLLLTRSAARRGAAKTRLELWLESVERPYGEILGWAALSLASYVAVALILQVAQWLSGTKSSFEWGHATATAFLTGVGVTLLVLGARRPFRPQLWLFGVAGVAIALVKLIGFDGHALADHQLTLAESLIAALVLAGAYVSARIGVNEARHAIYGLMPLSAVIGTVAIVSSLTGDDRGYAFAALGGTYALLTAACYVGPRDRSLISLLTVPTAVCATVAAGILVEGWWLAPTLAAAGATLLLLARALDEPRFQLFAVGFLVGVVGVALRFARPDHLLRAVEHPAAGIGAVVVAVALLALAVAAMKVTSIRDELDRAYAELLPPLRRGLAWSAATLSLYGASLLVLELFQHVGGDSVHTGFQRGETAVSGLWAVVGLALLCVGLFRRLRPARAGGLTLLGIALVKLFVFDLSNLSSISRALSFLLVGAALLGGGFVYQKLNAELGADNGARPA